MSKSILQDEKECFITGSTSCLHRHHIYGGRNRRVSEENGFWVYLRADYHTLSDYCVHKDRELDLKLKRICQTEYEKTHTREEFMELIGRNYL